MRPRAALFSAMIHAGAALALLWLAFHPLMVAPRLTAHLQVTPLRLPRFPIKPPGGGGSRSRARARRGQPPPPVVHRVFVPPMVAQSAAPKLVVEQALLSPPDISIPAGPAGDPFGDLGSKYGGPGGPLGVGNGPGAGVGPGDGDGLGAGSPVRSVAVTRPPKALFQPEPEYSEEARKVHYQGTVVLSIVIDAMGHPRGIRVVRGLGLGLDQKAIEAVRRWLFRPAQAGGRPVAVNAMVEVSFHLL